MHAADFYAAPPEPETNVGGSTPRRFPISRAAVHDYFQGVNTPRHNFDFDGEAGATFRRLMSDLPPASVDVDSLSANFSSEEVEAAVSRSNTHSSPGIDGIGHDIFKKFLSELLPVLHATFDACWKHGRVPAVWKVGYIQLIFKNGDPHDPTNWRPICLQACIYKLYSELLARRLTHWMEANGRLTGAQKRFRRMNGTAEHNFLSTAVIDQVKRRPRPLHMVWYDIKNAFGSVPHELIWRVLLATGATSSFVSRLKNIYEGAVFTVANTADGATDPIQLRMGVFQGCPLSPYLFLIGITPLVRALQALAPELGVPVTSSRNVSATAYADDLKTFSSSSQGITKAHSVVVKFLQWSTLQASARKCASLSVKTDSHGHLRGDSVELTLDGDVIPSLSIAEGYTYLGIGDGFNHAQHRGSMGPVLQEMKRMMSAIFRSSLAPWQKMKALKTYVYPKADYLLRHVRAYKTQLDSVDSALARGLRHFLKLNQSITTAMFHAPVAAGGLCFTPLVDLRAVLQISHAWQMLHSSDMLIREVAQEQVWQAIQKRFIMDSDHWRGRIPTAIQLFLNGDLDSSPFAHQKRKSGDIGSLWVDVKNHLAACKLKLTTESVMKEDGLRRT